MSQNQLPGAPPNLPSASPATPPNVSPSTPPQLQFFVARPEQNYGPYTLQEVNSHLVSGHIKAGDLAWHEGATGWVPLNQISGVVIPPVPVAPPPASYPHPVHPNSAHPQQPQTSGDSAEETTIFDTTPSVLSDAGLCAMTCGLWLAVTICRSLSTRYKLTTERLIVTSGLLSQSSEEVEIYRVKDVSFSQGALDRMLDVGTVTVIVSDASSPRIELKAISQPMKRKEQIRQMSRSSRKTEGVRSVEYLPPS